MKINVARVLPRSAANGPGERFVVWVQGCSIRCPGCWNPDTWSAKPRMEMEVDELLAQILSVPDIEGVTLTGGEPFEQADSLSALCEGLRQRGLSVVAFTGYQLDELDTPEQGALLALCDMVVSGPYSEVDRVADLPLVGSANQVVHHVSDRYADAGSPDAVCEIHLDPSGAMIVTGFPPAGLLGRDSR